MANKRETFFNYPNASQNVAVQRQLYFITKNDALSIVQVADGATSLTAQQLNVLRDRAIMIQYAGLIYTFVGATSDTLTYRHIVSGKVLKDMTITLPSGSFTVADVTISQDTPIVNVTFTAEEGVELSEADMILIQNDPDTILCADISALNHGYNKLYMTRGATLGENYSFIFSDLGDTYLVDVAYGYATYTYLKWETSYIKRESVTENSIYVEKADNTVTTVPLTAEVKPNAAVARNSFGGVEVNDVPSNDNEAISKKYADGRFVKNQSQYTNKPDNGVYGFKLDGTTYKDNIYTLAKTPTGSAVPQYDANGKLTAATPIDSDGANTVINKEYAGRFVEKRTGTNDNYYTYVYHMSEQSVLQVASDVISGAVVRRDDTGAISVPATPEKDNDAASKKYVDTVGTGKLDKVTGAVSDGRVRVYAVAADGAQVMQNAGTAANASWIPQRTPAGDVLVPDAPSTDNSATSKKYVDNNAFPVVGGTIQGDVVIAGNLTVTGDNKSADVENLRVKDLLIEVGKDNPGFTFPAGLKYKYSVDGKYSALVWDKNGIAHVGDVVLDANGNVNLAESTQLQALATRPESGTDGGIMVWDNENKTMMIDGQTVTNLQGDLAILQEGKLDKKTPGYDAVYGINHGEGVDYQVMIPTATTPVARNLVRYNENKNIIVPIIPSSADAAASKQYVDGGFVGKLQSHEGEYKVYANKPDGDGFYPVSNGAVGGTLAERLDGGRLVVGTPVGDGDAANKQYVDTHFVKSQSQYTEKPNYGVYTFLLDGGEIKDALNAFANYPQSYALAQYDSSAKLHSDTPSLTDADDIVANKGYVDGGFVKKQVPEEADIGSFAYVGSNQGGTWHDVWYEIRTRPKPYVIPLYDGDGDLAARLEPTYEGSATSKRYVDNLILQGGTSKAVKIGTYADGGLSVSASKVGNVVTMFLTAVGNIAAGTYTITVPASCHSESIGYDFTVNNTTTAAQIPSGVLGWTGDSDIAEGSAISLTWNHSAKTFTFSTTSTVSRMQYAIQYVAEDMTALNPSTSGKALATVESISNNVINISTDYQDAGSIFDCNSFEVEIYNPLTNNVDLSACSISDGIKSISAQSMLSNPLAGGIMTCKDDVIVLTGRKIGETLCTTCRVKRAREYLAIPVYQYCAGYQGDLIIHFGSGVMLNTDTFSIDTLVDATGTLILPSGTYSTAAQLPVVLSAEIVWDGNRRPVNAVAVSANRVNFFVGDLKISGSSNVSNYQQLYFGRTGNVNIAEHDPTPRIVFGG